MRSSRPTLLPLLLAALIGFPHVSEGQTLEETRDYVVQLIKTRLKYSADDWKELAHGWYSNFHGEREVFVEFNMNGRTLSLSQKATQSRTSQKELSTQYDPSPGLQSPGTWYTPIRQYQHTMSESRRVDIPLDKVSLRFEGNSLDVYTLGTEAPNIWVFNFARETTTMVGVSHQGRMSSSNQSKPEESSNGWESYVAHFRFNIDAPDARRLFNALKHYQSLIGVKEDPFDH